MKVNKAYKIRIYPNKFQAVQINRTIGCCRFLFNKMLAERREVYEKLKNKKDILKTFKYKTEKEWKERFTFLCEASSRALQQARMNLESAYQNYFSGRAKFPKFKTKKKSSESYREPQVGGCIEVKDSKLKLLKLGWVKLSYLPKGFSGNIKSVTVSKNKIGQYYVSILTEQDVTVRRRRADGVIGLDLGLTDFCVTSNGEFFASHTKVIKKYVAKLKFWQKKLSRQINGSRRREKSYIKLNQIYQKTKRLQDYYFWHLANKLCSENQAIGLETLSVNNLKKNRKLSRSIHLTSWAEFHAKLKQKAAEYGTQLYFAPKFYASTKTCFNCKEKQEMSLSERVYDCKQCGFVEHRDFNAALNLREIIKISSEYGENKHREIVRPVKLKFDFSGGFVEVLTERGKSSFSSF